MRRLQDEMPGRVYQRLFASCEISPQKKYHAITVRRNITDDSIGKLLPSDSTVGSRFTCADRQDSIEQKHALLSPLPQIRRAAHPDSQLAFDFLEDVFQ